MIVARREKEQPDKKSRLFAGASRKNRRFCLEERYA
jgi:hypothetical protein